MQEPVSVRDEGEKSSRTPEDICGNWPQLIFRGVAGQQGEENGEAKCHYQWKCRKKGLKTSILHLY